MTPGARVAAAAIAAAVLGIAGCDGLRTGPTVVETPDIVWEPSAPSGPLEDDPYVQAAVAAELGYVLAVNARDFTIAQLTETTTAERIEESFRTFLGRHGRDDPEAFAIPGPYPRSAISVTEHPDGTGADVLMCDVSGSWYITEEHPVATIEDVPALSMTFVVVEEDGVLKLDDVRGGEGACDPSGIAVGWFDPAPVPASGELRSPLQGD